MDIQQRRVAKLEFVGHEKGGSMTSRKPIPGQDAGTWGAVLNEFLDISLDANGQLRTGTVSDTTIAANAAIAESKLQLASDAAATTPSRRTLGAGPTQAAAGNDSRIIGAEQQSRKNQPGGYPGLDTESNLNVNGRVVRVGPVQYPYLPALVAGGPNSGYLLIDKSNSASDGSIVYRDQGDIRAEIGLAGDNDIHIKTVAGTSGNEVFTDQMIIQPSGKVTVTGALGIATIPAAPLHVTSTSAGTARTVAKIENTNLTGSAAGAVVELAGATTDWLVGTDAGLNGGNNFFVQDVKAGYPPRLLIDGNGNLAIGKDSPNYKLDVVGDIGITALGAGLKIKEGTNAKLGITTLVNGAATVATSAVTATSRIMLTIQSPGGTVGSPYIQARVSNASFTIQSTSSSDQSVVAWLIVDPS